MQLQLLPVGPAHAVGLMSNRDLPDIGPCDDAVCLRHATHGALRLQPVSIDCLPTLHGSICLVDSERSARAFVGGKLVGHPYLKWMLAKGESRTSSVGKVEL